MKTKLSQIVKERRKELGISVRSLAKRVGCSAQFISIWERGVWKKDPKDEIVLKLATELKLPKSKCLSMSMTTTDGTMNLKQAFTVNAEDSDKLVEFLDAAKKKIPSRTWNKILELVEK